MAGSTPAPRILFVVTHPMTARLLLRGQLAHLRRRGLDVTVVASPGPELDEVAEHEGVAVVPVAMSRAIDPAADLGALLRLLRVMWRVRPDIVVAGTPKAGLLGMLAARLLDVPRRVYTVRGLRLETVTGPARAFLTAAERAAAGCAHRVAFVSESLRRRYLELGLVGAEKTVVPGLGSSNGVDPERFRPAAGEEPDDRAGLDLPAGATRAEETVALAERLGLPPDEPVVGFVGRLTRDKGVADLLAAFERLVADPPNGSPPPRLLLVGDFEAGDPVAQAVRRRLDEDPRVVVTGFVEDSAPYYRLMDVLAFPSYREGFPNAPLEAAASGVPVVGYAATGTVDAVADGETGYLVPVAATEAFAAALGRVLADAATRHRLGEAGRLRIVRRFRRERVWEGWTAVYLDGWDGAPAAGVSGAGRTGGAAATPARPAGAGGREQGREDAREGEAGTRSGSGPGSEVAASGAPAGDPERSATTERAGAPERTAQAERDGAQERAGTPGRKRRGEAATGRPKGAAPPSRGDAT